MAVLLYVQMGFTIWMLVDSYNRGAGQQWFWIILFFQPVGAWVYFFTHKIHDLNTQRLSDFEFKQDWLRQILRKGPSLEQLRYHYRTNPCVHNRVQLANGLLEEKMYGEAASLFQEVLAQDKQDRESLYGLALCKANLGMYKDAIEYLNAVIAIEKAFQDYAPWQDLAHALWMDGQKTEAIRVLEKLNQTNPRIDYMTLWGSYLMKLEMKENARQVLEKAVEDFEHSPSFIKKSYRKPANQAKEMLKAIYGQR